MVDEEGSGFVGLDQLERIFWWGAGICWTIVALIVLGEFRGWWNDAGELGGTVATIIGGLLTVIALLINATKSQARAVRMGVTDNGRRLGLIHDGVRENGQSLGLIHDGVRENGRRLGMIQEGVETLHEDNQQLHRGNQQLHQDNEQLHQDNERQTDVLIEIRDRL